MQYLQDLDSSNLAKDTDIHPLQFRWTRAENGDWTQPVVSNRIDLLIRDATGLNLKKPRTRPGTCSWSHHTFQILPVPGADWDGVRSGARPQAARFGYSGGGEGSSQMQQHDEGDWMVAVAGALEAMIVRRGAHHGELIWWAAPRRRGTRRWGPAIH
jgi:hypothetical protein